MYFIRLRDKSGAEVNARRDYISLDFAEPKSHLIGP
jgi:hypothetical protein